VKTEKGTYRSVVVVDDDDDDDDQLKHPATLYKICVLKRRPYIMGLFFETLPVVLCWGMRSLNVALPC
jgi:hypothetical protein